MYRRKPCVSGQFYPASAKELTSFIKSHAQLHTQKKHAYAVMLPHAGYIYSGATAVKTVEQVIVPDTVLLLGPNHTGRGKGFSLMPEGIWETPCGTVSVDAKLAGCLLASSEYLEADYDAHKSEHSLEVLLPFLRYANPKVRIVPMTIRVGDLEVLHDVALRMADCLKGRDVLIVSSSDMTHYESRDSATEKDRHAVDAICALDEDTLARVVRQYDISMCGFVSTYMMIILAKLLGARTGTLVEYCTSGDVTHDHSQVVGYAGVILQ